MGSRWTGRVAMGGRGSAFRHRCGGGVAGHLSPTARRARSPGVEPCAGQLTTARKTRGVVLAEQARHGVHPRERAEQHPGTASRPYGCQGGAGCAQEGRLPRAGTEWGQAGMGLTVARTAATTAIHVSRLLPAGAHAGAGRHGKERTGPQTAGSPQLVRALALHGVIPLAGKPLGVTPWAGETCPDPGRLSTSWGQWPVSVQTPHRTRCLTCHQRSVLIMPGCKRLTQS